MTGVKRKVECTYSMERGNCIVTRPSATLINDAVRSKKENRAENERSAICGALSEKFKEYRWRKDITLPLTKNFLRLSRVYKTDYELQ